MTEQSIIIIGGGTTGAELAQRVFATWDGRDQPKVFTHGVHEVLNAPKLLHRAAVAWVMTDAPGWSEDPATFPLLAVLREREMPTMLTRQDERVLAGESIQDGVVAGPFGTEPAVLAAMLRTLLSQVVVLRTLGAELHILQAHHSGLCDQIGKIDEELRLAAQLQREFLPAHLPTVHRVGFRVLYRPAGYVSGDIYDVVRLDDNHVGFFVADAVGHGVPAALMTMFIKRALHTKEIDPAHPRGYRLIAPDVALAQLNHDLINQQADQVRTATACYGIIDCRTLKLQLARAGHPFPILLHADGRRQMLCPDGGLLGVFDEMDFELVTTQLSPGDRLLLYSDGFELAFPGGPGCDKEDRVANDRYSAEFGDLANGPLDQALERLVEKIDMQAGSLNQRDDLTVVCLDVARD